MTISRRVARFNRHVANHFIGPILSRMPGFGTIHHRGRRSGRAYRTPVKLFRRDGEYVITLPYGPRADWVRNVLAAGGCVLQTRGRRIPLTGPALFEDDGTTRMPAFTRAMLTRLGATTFLALRPAPPSGGARPPVGAPPSVGRSGPDVNGRQTVE